MVTILAVSYLRSVHMRKETAMTVVVSESAFAINYGEWISYSHWGMFPVQRSTGTARREPKLADREQP